jgi:hypothetical protein
VVRPAIDVERAGAAERAPRRSAPREAGYAGPGAAYAPVESVAAECGCSRAEPSVPARAEAQEIVEAAPSALECGCASVELPVPARAEVQEAAPSAPECGCACAEPPVPGRPEAPDLVEAASADLEVDDAEVSVAEGEAWDDPPEDDGVVRAGEEDGDDENDEAQEAAPAASRSRGSSTQGS